MTPATAKLEDLAPAGIAGQPIAVRITGDADSNNNGLFFHATDHLGSVMVLSDHKNGDIDPDTRTFYEPFGDRRLAPTDGLISEGYTGHQHNDSLGLVYMNARFYVSGIGRFASADTIVPDPANPQSYNRYAYVYNNPMKYYDPSGHCVSHYGPDGSEANEDLLLECMDVYSKLSGYFLNTCQDSSSSECYPRRLMNDVMMTYSLDAITNLYESYGFTYNGYDPNPESSYRHPSQNITQGYGCNYWEDCFEPGLPENGADYFSLGIGGGFGPGVSGAVTRDKFGNYYGTLSIDAGTPGASASATAGMFFDEEYDRVYLSESELENHLTGLSHGGAIGAGPGAGIVKPLGSNNFAVETGVYTPQLTRNWRSFTFMIYDNGSSHPWVVQQKIQNWIGK